MEVRRRGQQMPNLIAAVCRTVFDDGRRNGQHCEEREEKYIKGQMERMGESSRIVYGAGDQIELS